MVLSTFIILYRSLSTELTMVASIKLAVLAVAVVPSSVAFVVPKQNTIRSTAAVAILRANPEGQNEDEKAWTVDESIQRNEPSPLEFKMPNPFTEMVDIFSNLDDVIDDFFNKRMGNGEIFYGKRKYKPSGSVESEYNGGGFSDWRKIEAAREFREERTRIREEQQAKDRADK